MPSPVNIGWEVYAGAIAGVIPFAIGSYQFIARIVSLLAVKGLSQALAIHTSRSSYVVAQSIVSRFADLQLIQRRCSRCNGSGLIERGPFLRKCPECGGFFPWQGWKRFFTSTAAPGNGGVLRQPRNQDGVIYRQVYYVPWLFPLPYDNLPNAQECCGPPVIHKDGTGNYLLCPCR